MMFANFQNISRIHFCNEKILKILKIKKTIKIKHNEILQDILKKITLIILNRIALLRKNTY